MSYPNKKLAELRQSLDQERCLRQALEAKNIELESRLEEMANELNRTNQQISQQERLHALGQMASGIVHNFNNILTPILGYSELLLNLPEIEDKERVKQCSKMINTAAMDAVDIVHRLREFYRPREETTFRPVNLNKLVEQVISLTQPRWKSQAQASGITIYIETEFMAEIPLIDGDEAELRDVLINLVLNAVDAMTENGTITLRTYSDGEHVVLQVSDTGIGITEEVRQHLFEPFFTTKGMHGTGLGLSMVYNIIQRHGGQINVESEPGVGTTFVIRLSSLGIQQTEDSSQGAENPLPPLHVLIVDDESRIRQIVAEYLTLDGHTFEAATNGREGIEKFRTGSFDLVVTDQVMPEMSGNELAAAIKQIAPNTLAIMLTGFDEIMQGDGEKPEGVDMILTFFSHRNTQKFTK